MLTLASCAPGLQQRHLRTKPTAQELATAQWVAMEADVPTSGVPQVQKRRLKPTIAATESEIAEAQAALRRGLLAYHKGQYAEAERALKEAMTLYPFTAEAYFTLGKIYLLRGVAAQDNRRLDKGRRLVEMAYRLDANLEAAQAFLLLFPESTGS